ncbi:TRZ/ATZ family hydrolase [Arenimonas fontis]|uniref:TRZ/ATZ family hydrolase n=1 Tax=Arenimonas fontis TaxID=2608255 RepID=A0A5B2ZE23_9GAMM|nr:TRZ/ATZ family hydrolase [Arenimonas fontis]KAA2285494.1 TRZ/ATZ family hydrolase [Arenimonas fontis]
MAGAPAQESCDLLIEAGWVVPVEPHGLVLTDHAVAVRGGRILALMPSGQARERFQPVERVVHPDGVLIPGLVNAHCHNPMTLLRGVADDLPLMTWLQEHIWPIEGQVIGPDFVADGIELAVAEMLRGGITACAENYFFPDAQASTYSRLGFRALVGLPVIDFPTAWARTQDEYFDKALEVHDNWRRDATVSLCFVPHAPYTVSDAGFERIRMLADQLDLVVHCHIHETAHENIEALQKHGMRQLARLERLGLVNDRLMAVHMTDLNEQEIALCANRGVSVVHCPESNLKLASGFCPSAKLLAAGVNLAIGTDGCASNNDLDMFGEMRTAALLAKGVSGDASAMDAASALRAATLGGARAMGLGEQIGSIEPGKWADLTMVDLSPLETQPLHHVVSQLVYATGRHQVSEVWTAGRLRLREGRLLDIDVETLRAKARRWRERIAAIPGGA